MILVNKTVTQQHINNILIAIIYNGFKNPSTERS